VDTCPVRGHGLRTAVAGYGEPAPAVTQFVPTVVPESRSCAPDGHLRGTRLARNRPDARGEAS